MEGIDAWTVLAVAAGCVLAYTVLFALAWRKPVWSPPPGARTMARYKSLPAYEGLPSSVVVTGGLGFLGRHIVEALHASGVPRVVVFDLPPRPGTDLAWMKELSSAELVAGDLTKEEDLARALDGAEAVIHCASPHPQLASDALLDKVVVEGTRRLLAACDAHGVRSFVLTSSASVVFAGVDQEGADEDTPIPRTFRDHYSRCKAQSELDVLAKGRDSGEGSLRTAAVRPHGIFGPRDRQLVPGVCEVSSTWRGSLILGDGSNVVDFTYVGNVVHGHLLALQRLHREAETGKPAGEDGSAVSGRAFFVTNDEPIPFWEFIGRVKAGLGYPASFVRVPYGLALFIAQVQEAVAGAVASLRGTKPAPLHLSPQRVSIAGTHHWYRIDQAKAVLGYAPVWNNDESLALTLAAYPEHVYDGPGGVMSPLDAAEANAYPCDMPQLPYAWDEVKKHTTEDDLWLVVDGGVYDVTQFVLTHAGGPKALLRWGGRDASKGFHGDQHPDDVELTLQTFKIGWIEE